MKLAIKGRYTMLVEDATLVQNSQTPYPVSFTFSEDWDGFAKTALFEAGGASIAVVLTDDQCNIPAECLKKGGVRLKIAVYGTKGEETKATDYHVTSMILYQAGLSVGSGISGGAAVGDEAYQQIMAIIGDTESAGFGNKTLTEVIVEIRKSISTTATDEEVEDMLDSTFSSTSIDPDDEDESPDNTATDKEVEDILNDVFG